MARHKRTYFMPTGELSDHPWLYHAVKSCLKRKHNTQQNEPPKDHSGIVRMTSTDGAVEWRAEPKKRKKTKLTPLQEKERNEWLDFNRESKRTWRPTDCNELEVDLRDAIEVQRAQCTSRVMRGLLHDGWQVEAALAEARDVTTQRFSKLDKVMHFFDYNLLAPNEAFGVLKSAQKKLDNIQLEEEKLMAAEMRQTHGMQR